MGIFEDAVKATLASLQKQGITAFDTGSIDLPDIIVADDSWGFVALFLEIRDFERDASERNEQIKKRLRTLKREIGQSLSFDIRPVVLELRQDQIATQQSSKIRAWGIELGVWVEKNPITEPAQIEARDEIVRLFDSSLFFEKTPNERPAEDSQSKFERGNYRLKLDAEQAKLVQDVSSGVHLITGVAGSGKTLVLLAKARRMARENPSWKIRVVCFTNALKPYLVQKLGKQPGVTISTFTEVFEELGNRFRMRDTSESIAELDLKRQLHIRKEFDAILVDEAQDFHRAWIEYLARTIKPNGGGLTLAGDEGQAIFRDSNLAWLEKAAEVSRLKVPYRSTSEILKFVNALVPELQVENSENAPSGQVPSLVYVPAESVLTSLVAAITADLEHLYSQNQEMDLGQVAILCSRRFLMTKLQTAGLHQKLESCAIPGARLQVISKLDPQAFDPKASSIKLMTMHSSKGLEFEHVFLVGIDELAKEYVALPSNYIDSNELREARINLVAPTRAKETLTVYYSNDNPFIRNLYDHPETYLARKFPEDY